MVYSPAFTFASANPLGVLPCAGLRLWALRQFQSFLASSPCAASATSYHFASSALPPWRCAFSRFALVVKLGFPVLASGSNCAVKPTRLRRAAYFRSLGFMKSPVIPHFEKIDKKAIRAQFFDDGKHRATLHLPFIESTSQRTLCVIGQNPSAASEENADKTIRYLEELIYRKHPEYGSLLVLNLYSRIDTPKVETFDLLNVNCATIFDIVLRDNSDFLLVYGKLKNEGAYRFPERAKHVAAALKSKKVLQLGLNTPYPPHPGNPKILYGNFEIQLISHQLEATQW